MARAPHLPTSRTTAQQPDSALQAARGGAAEAPRDYYLVNGSCFYEPLEVVIFPPRLAERMTALAEHVSFDLDDAIEGPIAL